MNDSSNKTNPQHYQASIQAIDFIEANNLSYPLGCAVKYIARCGKKEGETKEDDLRKAIWYLEREINCHKT